MADEAPTQFVNLIDSFTTSDAFRACASWCGWLWKRNTAYVMEKVMRGDWKAEGSPYNTGTRINYPHAHAEQSSDCGITVRRALVNQSYAKGSASGEAAYQVAVDGDSWIELGRWPAPVGGFKNVAAQVRYFIDQGGIKFRLKYCNHTADGSCGSTVHYLQETAENTSTTVTWHVIKGKLDGAGSTVTNMTIDGPTSVTTPGDTTGIQELICEVARTQSTTISALALYHVFAWERLSTD